MIIHSPKELAMLIKNQRKKQKLSQTDIANQIGLKQSTISAFERKPETTKLETLFRILATNHLEIQIHTKDTPSKQTAWEEEW